MSKFTVGCLAVFSLFASPAFAEPAPVGQRADSPRLRLGVGLSGGVTESAGQNVNWGFGAGVGKTLHLGVQLNDRLAVFAFAQGQTLLLMHAWSGGAMVEAGLTDWLYVGAGLGAAGWHIHSGLFSYNTEGQDHSAQGVGVPLRLTVALGPSTASTSRSRFFFGVDGFVAPFAVSRLQPMWSLNTSLGYQLM